MTFSAKMEHVAIYFNNGNLADTKQTISYKNNIPSSILDPYDAQTREEDGT